MAFTYDSTTSRGRVRLLVGDTDTAVAANQIFEDAEIDAFLALADSDVWGAAAAACRSIAASASRSAIAWRELHTSVDKKDVPKMFLELAAKYEARSREGAPWEEIDSMESGVDHYGRDVSEYIGDTFWT